MQIPLAGDLSDIAWRYSAPKRRVNVLVERADAAPSLQKLVASASQAARLVACMANPRRDAPVRSYTHCRPQRSAHAVCKMAYVKQRLTGALGDFKSIKG